MAPQNLFSKYFERYALKSHIDTGSTSHPFWVLEVYPFFSDKLFQSVSNTKLKEFLTVLNAWGVMITFLWTAIFCVLCVCVCGGGGWRGEKVWVGDAKQPISTIDSAGILDK